MSEIYYEIVDLFTGALAEAGLLNYCMCVDVCPCTVCVDFVLRMHSGCNEGDAKKAIATKLNIAQKIKPKKRAVI